MTIKIYNLTKSVNFVLLLELTHNNKTQASAWLWKTSVTSKITEPKAKYILSMIVSGKRVDLTPQHVLLGK